MEIIDTKIMDIKEDIKTDIEKISEKERTAKFLIFDFDGKKFALGIEKIKRVVNIVELTPLPKAPEFVIGLINIQGDIIPVIDMRKILKFKESEINLSNKLIITQNYNHGMALLVNNISELEEFSETDMQEPEKIFNDIKYVEKVIVTKDGMILIPDIENMLSKKESESLIDSIKSK